MSIIQFLRIFWARRRLILVTTFCCLIGAWIVTLLLPPRWEAHSRVLLNLLKPDPITGQVIGANARSYAATQEQLITDYAVAGQVADQLGWLSDPNLIAAYQRRPGNDTRDFRRWLAQIVIDNTKTQLLEGSSEILEITYTASNPRDAKLVADALRKAYIDTSLSLRRSDAERNAQFFDAQASQAQAALGLAEASKNEFERQHGIVMADDKTDIETARLRALSVSGSGQAAAIPTPGPTPASIQLAETDAAIAEASKNLGPNHPEIQAMRAKRKELSGLAAQEQQAQSAAIASMRSAASGNSGAVASQKAKVIAQGGVIGKLAQLQLDVDLKREAYNKIAARASELRTEAAVGDTGLTPLGGAIVPKEPKFPNYWLIIPGSIVLGLGLGVLISLLLELFGRRVRCVEDMQGLIEAPLIGIIAAPANPPSRVALWWRRIGATDWRLRGRAAAA